MCAISKMLEPLGSFILSLPYAGTGVSQVATINSYLAECGRCGTARASAAPTPEGVLNLSPE